MGDGNYIRQLCGEDKDSSPSPEMIGIDLSSAAVSIVPVTSNCAGGDRVSMYYTNRCLGIHEVPGHM